MTEKKFDKHIPFDHSADLPAVYFDQAAAGQLPVTFDHSFIKRELARIQGNSSLLNAYLSSLRAKFKLAEQQKVINAMTRMNETLASGMKSQIEMEHLKRDYLLAVQDLETIKDDLEIQKLEKEDKKLDYQVKIAAKKKQIREFNNPPEPPPPEEPIDAKAVKLKEEEEELNFRTEKDLLKQKNKISRKLRVDDEKKKMVDEVTDQYLRNYNVQSVLDLPTEAIQELKDKKEDIEGMFDKAKPEF